jgi:hypothetical protein
MQEEDCVRLNRAEFEAVRCLLGAVSYTAHANDDLQKRLECIPYGRQRMSMVLGGLKAIADDLVGTVPRGQCKQMRNTMNDMEMRMVPKLSRMSQNVILEKDNAKALIDTAMEKCRGCVEDEKSCRNCGLYKVLESFLPLDDYENGMLCPYSMSEWKD